MVQSNHFSSELTRVSREQLDGVLPCIPGVHGTFDLTAEARYHTNFRLCSHALYEINCFDGTEVCPV